MTIQRAIELAIEGGYKKTKWSNVEVDRSFIYFDWHTGLEKPLATSWMIEKVILDPQFWQCLAKSLSLPHPSSMQQDLIAEIWAGGTIESYFAQLEPTNQKGV